jgi:hypothetical protein
VYVLSGTVTLGGGQVVSNTAEDGGGVYVAGDSGVFTQTGNSTIKNNTADYGGGVFVHEGSALLSSGEVTSNTADRGGGVHVKSGSVVLTSGKIVGNAASFYGGGVYVSGGILGDGILDQMADGIIAHNTADYGGGVYVSGGNATLSGGEVLSNTASQSGGGLFVTSGGNVELSGGEILSNTATSHGGGVFVEISASVFSQTTGSTIAYNMADCGGGVCVTGGNAALSGGEIISNTATSHGGGVFVSSGNATLSGGQILSNTAEDDGGGVYVKYANAIFTQAGNSTIAHNAANYGGGVYVYEGNATLSGGEIISNTATSHGGGVFVYDGSATLHSGQILSNTATFGGGGVSVAADSAVFTQTGNSIIAHNAANYGGGVYVEDGSAMLSGGEVTSNTADRGGGVHVNFGSVVLTSGKIVSNTADYGGGVCIFWTSAIFTQTGTSTIAYNTAKYDGGGTFVDKGSAVLSGGWIVSNAATSKGSGLYNSTGVVTITTPLTISGDVHQANGTFHASNHDLRIEGDLSLAGGDFHAPSALTLTDRFTHTGGSYHQTQDVLGSAEVGFPKAGGIIINANGNDLSSTQVSIRAGQDCTAQAGETVRHCYDITPTNSTGVSATISFFYNDSERAGHACNALNAHRWDGGGWSDPLTLENAYGTGGRACGANPLSLRVKDVTDFSPFALKSDRVYLPLALRTAP